MPEDEAAKLAGPTWVAKYDSDVTLQSNEILLFAKDFHLRSEYPSTLFPLGYENLLKKYGPLWIGTAIDNVGRYSFGHARVLYGIVGSDSGTDTTMYLMDPSPVGTGAGSYKQSYEKLLKELEAWARSDQNHGNQNFNPQILHY
jgi:hypothetical protein